MEKGKFAVKLIVEASTDEPVTSVAALQESVAKFLRIKARDTIMLNGVTLKIYPGELEIAPLSIEVCSDDDTKPARRDSAISCPLCDLDFLNKTAWEQQAREAMRKENERYSEVMRLRAALQLVYDYQFMELEDFRANHPELMGLETNGAIHILVWHKVKELLKNTGEQK